jgi:hypothetical protein
MKNIKEGGDMKNYKSEFAGQHDFFESYKSRINGYQNLELKDILFNHTDGVINGNILEFKLKINDIAKTLFQAIKYLSIFRIVGKPIPAVILLVDLNGETVYKFDSFDYLDDIEKIYETYSSKRNEGFSLRADMKN